MFCGRFVFIYRATLICRKAPLEDNSNNTHYYTKSITGTAFAAEIRQRLHLRQFQFYIYY